MPDTVYVLTNEAMPGLIKVGMTTDAVEARLTALSSATGVPLPFECHFAAEVKDAARIKKTLHQLFAEARVNPKREFFRLDPEKVVLAVSIGEYKEVTPGAVLQLARDESIQAVVMADGKVVYDGETLSPSAAALKALHKLGYQSPAASGSEYWMFDGETLDERRRLEAEQFDQAGPASG